ncbi:MAG: radical SAM protein [Deltaproteobacteria bacterium]|nr:radical SAM protein [Deltaproteobacteria bacterium]
MKTQLNIHAVIPSSRVNGPGARLVVFFQGCARLCGGCFNPETHSFGIKEFLPIDGIFERIQTPVEGITVSGGEPFAQTEGLILLLKAARERSLSTIVYTGYTIEELNKIEAAREALKYIDVLVDGPFIETEKEPTLLARGSSNQGFHFLTNRYSKEDFIMDGKVEVTIKKDGSIVETGFSRVPFRAGFGR